MKREPSGSLSGLSSLQFKSGPLTTSTTSRETLYVHSKEENLPMKCLKEAVFINWASNENQWCQGTELKRDQEIDLEEVIEAELEIVRG